VAHAAALLRDRLDLLGHVGGAAGVLGHHGGQRRAPGAGQLGQVRPAAQHRPGGGQRGLEGVPHVRERPPGQRQQPPQIPVGVGDRGAAAHAQAPQRQLRWAGQA